MRRSCALGALTAVLLLGGCDLSKDNDCATDPGLTTGGQTVCTQPPPTNFDKLGQ